MTALKWFAALATATAFVVLGAVLWGFVVMVAQFSIAAVAVAFFVYAVARLTLRTLFGSDTKKQSLEGHPTKKP